MSGEIVLAFTPSSLHKDWMLGADTEVGQPAQWYYVPVVSSYCSKHKRADSMHCSGTYDAAARSVGREPYYNLKTNRAYKRPPRIYIDHYPQKGEWEHLKTIDDIRKSPLYVKDNVRFA